MAPDILRDRDWLGLIFAASLGAAAGVALGMTVSNRRHRWL